MATKKVATKKKPGRPAKKAVKKSITKKATKKVTKKRAYNRKPKVDVNPVAEQAVPDVKHDDQMDALPYDIFGTDYGEVQSNASVLREIEVIDLRELEDRDRFGILCMLDSEGYITSTVESLLMSNNLLVGLEADTLVLNHQNKLVRPATWEEASANSDFISRPSVDLNVQIGFSHPEPAYPDTTQIGEALYMRVR